MLLPWPIVILTGLAVALRLIMGGYYLIKPSIFVAIISAMAIGIFSLCLKSSVRRANAMLMLTIAVCLPLLAWSLPSIGLLFVLMCLWVLIAAGRFNLTVPVYLFSLLLLPSLSNTLMLGGLKLVEFDLPNALSVGTAISVFLHPGKVRRRVGADAAVFALLLLIALAMAREASVSHHIRYMIGTLLDFWLPYYIASRGIRSDQDLKGVMLWLGAAGIVLAGVTLFEFLKSWPIYQSLYHVYELPTLLLVKFRAGMLRAGGPFIESTSAAMMIALCVVGLYLSKDSFRSQSYHFLLLGIALAGLFAPQSRGAWIGLCFAVVIADGVRRRYAHLALKLLMAGGVFCVLYVAAHFSSFLSQQMGFSGGASDTADYRSRLLERGLEEIAHRPFLGYSIREMQIRLADMVQGEGIIDPVNTYIWITLISGLVGLAIFMGVFAYFLLRVIKSIRSAKGSDIGTGLFVFLGIAVWMEMLFFTSFAALPAVFLFVLYGLADAFVRLREPVVSVAAHARDSSPVMPRNAVPATGAV